MLKERAKVLSERLAAQRFEPEPQQNPYLKRLEQNARFLRGERVGAGLGDLQREIFQEMASALGRAEAHVLNALDRLVELGARIDELERAPVSEARDAALQQRIGEFDSVREVARRRRWELIVHREALGFRMQTDIVERTYPIPPARRVYAVRDP